MATGEATRLLASLSERQRALSEPGVGHAAHLIKDAGEGEGEGGGGCSPFPLPSFRVASTQS